MRMRLHTDTQTDITSQCWSNVDGGKTLITARDNNKKPLLLEATLVH